MKRYMFHIVTSVVCILLPVFVFLYGLWDIHQPQIGPVGDGKPRYPTITELIPIVSCFILGVVNLPLAIMRYRKNKNTYADKKN